MTREEIEKAFPIESKIFYNKKESFLYQEIAEVIDYCGDCYTWFLCVKWEDKKTQESLATTGLDPDNFTLVPGPAVQEPENHDGMIYNPFTGKWSWF